jgi:NADH:ubiquinone oxidoreductase subunit H
MMSSYAVNMLVTLLLTVLKIVCLLVAIAYFTLAERKIMAAVQRRVGPNVVGPLGLLQPLADGLKLAGKELAIPAQASSRIFLAVAISVLLFALCGWMAIPFGMFDHSENLNNETVTKILTSTDSDPITSNIKHHLYYMVEPNDALVAPEDITPEHFVTGRCIITYFENDTCVFLRV